MLRSILSPFASGVVLLSLAVAFTAVDRSAMGADAVKSVLSKKPRARGRLPAHYDQVVTDEQREKIYDIQGEYKPKIDALDAQLKALRAERDEKIAALLSAEQKKMVAEAAAKAKADQRAKAAAPTENAPPPPAGQNPVK